MASIYYLSLKNTKSFTTTFLCLTSVFYVLAKYFPIKELVCFVNNILFVETSI
jgi:hypothetical protein